jgi:hypothetical protein
MAPPRTEGGGGSAAGQRKISAFFVPKATSASDGQPHDVSKEPPAKRQRLTPPAAQHGQPQSQPSQPTAHAFKIGGPPTPAPGRDASALAAKARRKLATGQTGDQLVYDPTKPTEPQNAAAGGPVTGTASAPIFTPGKGSKLTPLEQQVVALKQVSKAHRQVGSCNAGNMSVEGDGTITGD